MLVSERIQGRLAEYPIKGLLNVPPLIVTPTIPLVMVLSRLTPGMPSVVEVLVP
jgi:hypothetical protein